MMRIALVTNIPAPYRIAAWNIVAEKMGNDFLVLFCAEREPNRQWNVPAMKFRHQFLKEHFTVKKDGTTVVHNNGDVWKHLKAFNPDVVITSGFNPTMLYAFFYCLAHRKKHIPISDAWQLSELHLSAAHRMLRKTVFRFSQAFIACSLKGKSYYQQYGKKPEQVFISHYTITTSAFDNNRKYADRPFDLLFSGQFIERKNPLFFIEVASLLKKKKPDIHVLLLGDGPLRQSMLQMLAQAGIQYTWPGYVAQQDLPQYYAQARLFLFPTSYDAWGVVAHESLAAGTPVLVTPFAGCSDELVLHDQNGYILPLETALWAEQCAVLLQDEERWQRNSAKAKQTAGEFTHERAADALWQAGNYARNQ
jgi:glycosyltransferase involved in cell wall biosynthesis